MTEDEINLRMDELVREYGKTPPGDPRRTEIANELSELLCLVLDRLRAPQKMNVSTALAILDDAVSRCMTENVNTPEVLAALDFLGAQATIRWPFEQYRKALAPKEGEFDFDREGRRQVLNASLNGIKRAVKREA